MICPYLLKHKGGTYSCVDEMFYLKYPHKFGCEKHTYSNTKDVEEE